MYDAILVVGLVLTVAAVVAATKLQRGDTRLQVPAGDFGGRLKPETVAPPRSDEQRLVLNALLSQQRWAFALLWFATAVGLCLATAVIARIAFAKTLDLKTLGAGIGVVADLWLGSSAWKLYHAASKKLDHALG